jgi:hypothetical protein
VLGFDQVDLDVLAEDWSAGGAASSYVLVVETSQPKTPANFILSSDGAAYPLASRALLAMRLLGAGAPHFGRMFLKRPAAFNTGIGGHSYAGFTIWWPGAQYNLNETMIPEIRQLIDTLIAVEKDLEINARHIGLALRSFSSMFDRLMHQGEDCVIDSITALEALWKLDRSSTPCVPITAFGAKLFTATGFGIPSLHSYITMSHFVRSCGKRFGRSSICSQTLVSGQLSNSPRTLMARSCIRENDRRFSKPWPFYPSALRRRPPAHKGNGMFSKRIELTHYSNSQYFILSLNLSLNLPESWRAFSAPC